MRGGAIAFGASDAGCGVGTLMLCVGEGQSRDFTRPIDKRAAFAFLQYGQYDLENMATPSPAAASVALITAAIFLFLIIRFIDQEYC